MSNVIYKKDPGESFEEYCHRISSFKTEIDATWEHIANIINENTGMNYSGDKYRKQEKRYQEGVSSPSVFFEKETTSFNYEKGEATSYKELPLTQAQLLDPEQLIKAHGYDPKKWSIKTATNSKTSRVSEIGQTNVYVSRIVLKEKDPVASNIAEVAEYFKTFKSERAVPIATYTLSDESLVVPLYDLHFGRLPDSDGFTKYDINEEKEKIINHVAKYISKFSKRNFKSIYLVVGQDFLNSSFTGFTSSQSHLQSNAIDFRTMFKAGSELLISIIDMFSAKTCDLNVIGSVGNHDVAEEQMLFMLLKAYYRNDSNIHIDDGFAPRKYYRIGNACVGFGHLDKENKRAFGLMQYEAKDIWSETKTHVFIAGHLHHFSVSNENGIELYRIPTICPPDRWTREQGYVMNEPKTMCFVFNEEEGLIETHFMFL